MNEDYSKIFDKVYEEREPNFNECINIAFIGKVSTGKSSLINAVMLRDRNDPIVEVGATSGVTTEVKAFKLDDHVLIIDSPGLDDIRKENSAETKQFLSNVDLGIMVVTGSADSSQKKNYEDLLNNAGKVVVVLNKIDEWDDLEESALTDVIEQWKRELGVEHIYPTCTKGYDPRLKKDAPMDIRGVEELNEDIWGYLRKEGKDLLLARHLGDKRKYAAGIIATALVAVAGEAFIPGSAAYITATQTIAITSLYYLYTGNVLSKGNVLALLPTFMGESVGVTVFLWVKSFLPPTGVVDVAAAGVAVGITFAMLASVTYLLSTGLEINQKNVLKEKFKEYKDSTVTDFTKKIIDAVKNGGSIKDMTYKLLFV
jgi:small GTP-binding protein